MNKCGLILLCSFVFVSVAFSQKDRQAPKPLYADPVYDGAADPVV